MKFTNQFLLIPYFPIFIEEKRESILGKVIEDNRITTIRHEQDPIPKLGNSINNHKKNNRIIIKATNKIKEKLNEIIKLKNTAYHSVDGYISEVYKGNLLAEDPKKIFNSKIQRLRNQNLNKVTHNFGLSM